MFSFLSKLGKQGEYFMNKDIFEGKWNEYKGKVKEKWGKLTDSELTEVNGKRDQLLGKLQTRYGWSKDAAAKELEQFEDSLRKGASKLEEFPKMARNAFDKDETHEQKRKVQ